MNEIEWKNIITASWFKIYIKMLAFSLYFDCPVFLKNNLVSAWTWLMSSFNLKWKTIVVFQEKQLVEVKRNVQRLYLGFVALGMRTWLCGLLPHLLGRGLGHRPVKNAPPYEPTTLGRIGWSNELLVRGCACALAVLVAVAIRCALVSVVWLVVGVRNAAGNNFRLCSAFSSSFSCSFCKSKYYLPEETREKNTKRKKGKHGPRNDLFIQKQTIYPCQSGLQILTHQSIESKIPS